MVEFSVFKLTTLMIPPSCHHYTNDGSCHDAAAAAAWQQHKPELAHDTTTDGHSHLQQCGGKFLKLRPEGSFYR